MHGFLFIALCSNISSGQYFCALLIQVEIIKKKVSDFNSADQSNVKCVEYFIMLCIMYVT